MKTNKIFNFIIFYKLKNIFIKKKLMNLFLEQILRDEENLSLCAKKEKE